MIVRMTKYDFVLFRERKDDFLEKLQDLGLVDITTSNWEPDDNERELMLSIDRHKTAVSRLRNLLSQEGFEPGQPYSSGEEAYREYMEASTTEDNLTTEIVQARKEVQELKVWGDFNPAEIAELEKKGIVLHYFSAYTKEFNHNHSQWEQNYTIVPINDVGGITYFVVVSKPGEEILINAQEIKAPSTDYKDKEKEISRLESQRQELSHHIARAAASVDLIEQHGAEEAERLHLSQAGDSGQEAAEGTLVILEGWATAETAQRVDAMLEEYPDLFYIKSDPTPEDEPPVLLKNNRFNRIFEFIGNFYSLPKYGTMDLTPFFGPFYVLFFALCLADAGYGLLFLIGGLVMMKKMGPKMKDIAKLVTLCGAATMVAGTFMGSFFGISFQEYGPFVGFQKYILSADNLFVLALGIGIFQILFGMFLKAYMYAKQFGFRYALSTLGWILVIISSLIAYLSPNAVDPEGNMLWSTPHLIAVGIGLFMMLFLNSPGKNPLVNFGAGLWNLYNDLTGILGDTLSYIRLFAIGLSGGILAGVFNQLALGLSPDIPVVREIMIVLILVIGHGITFFMSSLSAFVHPMRLTFVEFYKNAGFETTQRAFTPLRRIKDSDQ